MDEDLDRLNEALAAADRDHADDIAQLWDLDGDQLDYLARLDEINDPSTDGIECGGV